MPDPYSPTRRQLAEAVAVLPPTWRLAIETCDALFHPKPYITSKGAVQRPGRLSAYGQSIAFIPHFGLLELSQTQQDNLILATHNAEQAFWRARWAELTPTSKAEQAVNTANLLAGLPSLKLEQL